jgi:hypothetical protein
MRKREKPLCRPLSLKCPFTPNVAIKDSGTEPFMPKFKFSVFLFEQTHLNYVRQFFRQNDSWAKE